jgi:hypothetical protein
MRIIQGVAVAAEELVLEIRALERAGTTHDALSRRFRLPRVVVARVCHHRPRVAPTVSRAARRACCAGRGAAPGAR